MAEVNRQKLFEQIEQACPEADRGGLPQAFKVLEEMFKIVEAGRYQLGSRREVVPEQLCAAISLAVGREARRVILVPTGEIFQPKPEWVSDADWTRYREQLAGGLKSSVRMSDQDTLWEPPAAGHQTRITHAEVAIRDLIVECFWADLKQTWIVSHPNVTGDVNFYLNGVWRVLYGYITRLWRGEHHLASHLVPLIEILPMALPLGEISNAGQTGTWCFLIGDRCRNDSRFPGGVKPNWLEGEGEDEG